MVLRLLQRLWYMGRVGRGGYDYVGAGLWWGVFGFLGLITVLCGPLCQDGRERILMGWVGLIVIVFPLNHRETDTPISRDYLKSSNTPELVRDSQVFHISSHIVAHNSRSQYSRDPSAIVKRSINGIMSPYSKKLCQRHYKYNPPRPPVSTTANAESRMLESASSFPSRNLLAPTPTLC